MNDNIINLIKICISYPIGFITLFLLSNYKNLIPNFKLIKYNLNDTNINNEIRNLLTMRKNIISETNKKVILVLILILTNLFIVSKNIMKDVLDKNKNNLYCEINSDYEKTLNDKNFIETIKNKCNKSNNYNTLYGRCFNCNQSKIDNMYQCQIRNLNTQNVTKFKSDEQCKIYNNQDDNNDNLQKSNFLIENFFILLISCVCLTFLIKKKIISNKFFNRNLIDITIYIIIYLLIISNRDVLFVNNIFYIVLLLIIILHIMGEFISKKINFNVDIIINIINFITIIALMFIRYQKEEEDKSSNIMYDIIVCIIMLIFQLSLCKLI